MCILGGLVDEVPCFFCRDDLVENKEEIPAYGDLNRIYQLTGRIYWQLFSSLQVKHRELENVPLRFREFRLFEKLTWMLNEK